MLTCKACFWCSPHFLLLSEVRFSGCGAVGHYETQGLAGLHPEVSCFRVLRVYFEGLDPLWPLISMVLRGWDPLGPLISRALRPILPILRPFWALKWVNIKGFWLKKGTKKDPICGPLPTNRRSKEGLEWPLSCSFMRNQGLLQRLF